MSSAGGVSIRRLSISLRTKPTLVNLALAHILGQQVEVQQGSQVEQVDEHISQFILQVELHDLLREGFVTSVNLLDEVHELSDLSHHRQRVVFDSLEQQFF